MIRPLRQRHRRLVGLLAVGLPLLYVAGLAARHPIPAADVPAKLVELAPLGASGETWMESWPEGALQATRLEDVDGRIRLWLEPVGSLRGPELLVYWAADRSQPTSPTELPEPAWLLGRIAGSTATALHLPQEANAGSGRLIFYDLAHRETIAEMDLRMDGAP